VILRATGLLQQHCYRAASRPSELDLYEGIQQAILACGVSGKRGRAGQLRELGSLVHSYRAERAVPDQDASFRASRLGVAGPIFGDGREPRRAPVIRHPRPPDAPEIGVPDEPGLLGCLQARAFGSSPVVRYRHTAIRSFLANATAEIFACVRGPRQPAR